ncbi:uncharacterized protein LOC144368080 [Ictidomys tridecemlineatus]
MYRTEPQSLRQHPGALRSVSRTVFVLGPQWVWCAEPSAPPPTRGRTVLGGGGAGGGGGRRTRGFRADSSEARWLRHQQKGRAGRQGRGCGAAGSPGALTESASPEFPAPIRSAWRVCARRAASGPAPVEGAVPALTPAAAESREAPWWPAPPAGGSAPTRFWPRVPAGK